MKNLSIILCAAALAVASAVPALAENVAFQQILYSGSYILGYDSDNVINHPSENQTMYDNFSVISNTTLGRVQWDGDFYSGETAVNGFTLTIYADNPVTDTPGFAVYQEQVAGVADMTFNGTEGAYDEDTYSAAINFQAAASTQYWLSIVANTQALGDWGWHISVGGDNLAYVTGVIGSSSPRVPYDMAFTLFDNTVTPPPPAPPTAATPEPSSLMLLGTGALGIAGTMRRRFACSR